VLPSRPSCLGGISPTGWVDLGMGTVREVLAYSLHDVVRSRLARLDELGGLVEPTDEASATQASIVVVAEQSVRATSVGDGEGRAPTELHDCNGGSSDLNGDDTILQGWR
jgi:hypothetical protein